MRFIGRMTTNGTFSYYAIPTLFAENIVAGRDGALWFYARGKIARITTSGSARAYSIPLHVPNGVFGGAFRPMAAVPPGGYIDYVSGIAAGSDGAIWYTNSFGNLVGRLDPAAAVPDPPLPPPPASAAPALSTWGLAVLGLLLTLGACRWATLPRPPSDSTIN
jgi:virginiamycin B lyase